MDELHLINQVNSDFSRSAALCFTETWLNESVQDSAIELRGFQIYRADRVMESSGKTRGGGICFYVNDSWCKDVTVLAKSCSEDLEALFINCKPFYSPREFSSVILGGIYIPPQACNSRALQDLADLVTQIERNHPDSIPIVLGDFNKANLTQELPRYRQHVSCPTRDKNTLDHCYTTVKGAYRSVPRAAIGLSDHCMIFLIPTYKQRLKAAKPVVRTVKRWTEEAKLKLQACFDCTDWNIFGNASDNLDAFTDTVTSYISFCEDLCVPTKTFRIYNNNKPWFTPRLKQLRHAKEEAYRKGDRSLYKHARNALNKEIRVAKRTYSEKLKNQVSNHDSATIWRNLQTITGYKKTSPTVLESHKLAEDLNEFYCRFERQLSPSTVTYLGSDVPTDVSSTTIFTPESSPLTIYEEDVRGLLQRQKANKAPGADGVTPLCLKVCAIQLAPILTQIFNTSLELCKVPSCFKNSIIIPVPKKPSISGLNDYRPVALTSVVMKVFERLVLAHLKDITDPLLDPLQFAYRTNRSVDDTVNMALHYILQHLDSSGTYARVLFVDFSSAFNTIVPANLCSKLTHLRVSAPICQWILSFLTDRKQLVRLGKITSSTRTISTGAPQGCVLSPLLFSLYTNDCTSTDPSVKILKFADDTTVIGLIRDGDESAYRREVEQLVLWCSRNHLELNPQKTVEMRVDFRKHPLMLSPLSICGNVVSVVESFKFLGSVISQDLKWSTNISSIIKKAHQRLFFLRQLRKFNLPQELMILFYRGIIESVLCNSITVWFGTATKLDKKKLQRTIGMAEKIIGVSLPSMEDLYIARVRKRAVSIAADPLHPGHILFELLPSGRRYRTLYTKTSRHKDSFFPCAIKLLNQQLC